MCFEYLSLLSAMPITKDPILKAPARLSVEHDTLPCLCLRPPYRTEASEELSL